MLQFSIGVEYGLHCLLYLVDHPEGKAISVKELSTFQGISETYLSKVFTKLKKSGIVRSTPGVKGGYELARDSKDISFWDVIEAIEGNSNLFQCAGILKSTVINTEEEVEKYSGDCPCIIKNVMLDAEEQMRIYLREKSLYWLNEKVKEEVSETRIEATKKWFTPN
ncbi:RrF2 family transcriptional regulator [Ilyobacter polytropus]|uniref:Transcriptional regulator, BadM/Rrf2 family n=1 Tax=Ilyobacter polytropus (strain ATCC 51220 / DSM 2926 / LMG 16218 / CuHBu1) TaxID=572544 RepID=E3H6J3_ILYPC|nr:Rrf2 family transcriptional regulator [Ilyobacter polytropus]ADO81878.1 transcriptional regulator, BadM/Rrf2 family [Ilyobacter polytropus DSM 2926]